MPPHLLRHVAPQNPPPETSISPYFTPLFLFPVSSNQNPAKMQSRLTQLASSSSRLFSTRNISRNEPNITAAAMYTTRTKTADPKIHSADLDPGFPEVHANEPQGTEKSGAVEADREKGTGTDPLIQPKPPVPSSAKIGSADLNRPTGHNYQQKRAASGGAEAIEEVSCAGLDGSPWPEEKEEAQESKRNQAMDDKEYFKHHKASPLAEIEVADTRKPLTQATDGTAGDATQYGAGRDVIGWRMEQVDSAEEVLLRAARIWKENAMRGDPDSPHGRRLRELRGEWF